MRPKHFVNTNHFRNINRVWLHQNTQNPTSYQSTPISDVFLCRLKIKQSYCANCSPYTNPTQGNDLTYPLRSNTLMQESHLQIPENIWCKRNFNFICSQPAEEMQLSRIVLFRTASHFKCSLLYIGQHFSAKSWNHQSPKWNSQHTKPSWSTFLPSLVWPLANLVRSSDFCFPFISFFSGLVWPDHWQPTQVDDQLSYKSSSVELSKKASGCNRAKGQLAIGKKEVCVGTSLMSF